MIGLLGTLDMGARSLGVQQEEMEISGQNVSNANNTSYAEEQLVVSESTPLDTSDGQEGTGVESTGITEIRNPLLDSQIQAETSVTGSLTAQQTSLQNAEAYLDEQISSTSSSVAPDSPNGLAADLSNLFDSFSSLANDPSNLAERQTTVQSAQQVAAQFNQVSAQLSTVQSDLNTSVQNDVASSNQDLSTIASLNQQIVAAQASGGNANPLLDEREQTLENLAGLANFTTTTEANGAVDVNIGGVSMVSGNSVEATLQTYTDGNGNQQVQAVNSSTNAATQLTLSGGSIAGEITARDGALATLQSGLNTLASQLITQVNSVYSAGYDLNGDTGQDLFTGTDASSIGVNSNVSEDPSQFQAAAVAGAPGDNTVVLALAQLGNQNIAGLNNQTFSGSYAQTVANLGGAIATVNDQLTTSQSVSQMLTSQRASASGVSIDTEMTNLIQYQKAYEASAELISTVDQMLQTVVQMPTN